MIFSALIAVFVLTWILTGLVRKYAVSKQMVDIPNYRSSHVTPTPRGGGVAFVSVFLLSIIYLTYVYGVSLFGGVTLLGALFFVAFLGFYDDHKYIIAHWRFFGQILAGIIGLYSIGFVPDFVLFKWTIQHGFILNTCAVIYLVWMLNLYNFMDGIDGLASLEAISVCLGISVIYWITGNNSLMLLPLILSMAITGFFYWNIPPARIFMGDVGSSFLGFIFGILSIQSIYSDERFFWCWLILLGVFIVDATITLLLRMIKGEKIHMAHCSHAYQHAARFFNSHSSVTGGVLILNLLWLWPIAIMVGLKYLDGFLGLIIAYIPICVLAVQFNAGQAKK
ncbi:MAG: glycosyltransferase family 4 protein [Legionellaceae bacterium]|nr:glycosyltransferase family 4 protein [Legionellaceae bacterium]